MEKAKLAKTASDSNTDPNQQSGEPRLPQTLVRIPTEHAPTLQAQTEGLEGAAAEEEGTERT
jgi:DASH complex subunit DAD2